MERRRYSKELKDQLIGEAIQAGNASAVAKCHGIDPRLLSRWIQESKHNAWDQTKTSSGAKEVTAYTPSLQEFRELENENNRLKLISGDKDLEIAWLKDLVKKIDPGLLKRSR